MTDYERSLLKYFRTDDGEKEWRVSDLAYTEYMRLENLEKIERLNEQS